MGFNMNNVCEKIYNNTVKPCCKNFMSMNSSEKLETVIKTACTAVACGIIGGTISTSAAVVFPVFGGVAAFYYMTRNYNSASMRAFYTRVIDTVDADSPNNQLNRDFEGFTKKISDFIGLAPASSRATSMSSSSSHHSTRKTKRSN
jgi:hypothetical protein